MRIQHWTEEEEKTLIDSVNACKNSHQYNGHTVQGHDWNRVSRLVSEKHGTYRSNQSCKCRQQVLRKRGVEV